MMKKILVLGGSHSDQPLIESALSQGLRVYTTGNDPIHPGHRISHGYIQGDYSRPDVILDMAKRLEVDFILPGANDFAMTTAALVAEKMNLPGYDSYSVVRLLHHKDEFRSFANSISMPICRYEIVSAEKSGRHGVNLRYPLLVKPVDLTGGKGITKINEFGELAVGIEMALEWSRCRNVVLEEWFDGDLHSYSVIVIDGKIFFEYFDSEFCVYQEYLVSTSLSICNVSSEIKKEIKHHTSKMIKELDLVDGVLHCQFLATKNEFRILEYTRRMSGDLYSRVVQRVRGIRHADVFVLSATGRRLLPVLCPAQPTHPFVSRHCVTSEQTGNFAGLLIDPKILGNVESVTFIVPFGTSLKDDGRSKVGVITLIFKTEHEMQSFRLDCRSLIKCRVET